MPSFPSPAAPPFLSRLKKGPTMSILRAPMQGLNPGSGLGDTVCERGFGQMSAQGQMLDPSLAQWEDHAKFVADNETPRPEVA